MTGHYSGRRWCRVVVVVLGLVIAVNVVAYRHAWRMTHFVPDGERTSSPQHLSLLGKVTVLWRGVTVPRPGNDGVPWRFARTVRFQARDGVQLEAWDLAAPSNRGTVILFHGYAGSKSALRPEAALFHELGYRCVLVDFRGSGGSEGTSTTLGWREALDVAAAAAWVGQPVILYGQSMGAAAVLRAVATEEVQPFRLVLDAPYARLVQTVGHRYEAMSLPAWPLAQLLVFWGGRQHGFNAFSLNPVEYARAVQCPALVVVGDRDPWVKVTEARWVADAMNGYGQFHVLVDVGHGGYLAETPDRYREILRNWLEFP